MIICFSLPCMRVGCAVAHDEVMMTANVGNVSQNSHLRAIHDIYCFDYTTACLKPLPAHMQ